MQTPESYYWSADAPEVDSNKYLKLLLNKEYEELGRKFLEVLDFFESQKFISIDPERMEYLDRFLKNFFYVLTTEEVVFSNEVSVMLLRHNALIANLTCQSSYLSTDVFISALEGQRNNLTKYLTLCSPRNTLPVNRKTLFDTNAEIASLWYNVWFDSYITGLACENVRERLREHLAFEHPKLSLVDPVTRLCYGSSYVDPDLDKLIKTKVNGALQRRWNLKADFSTREKTNKIAVISGCWRNTHAVYKNQFAFVESLRDDYELTFYPLGPKQDESLFHKTGEIINNGSIDLTQITSEPYRMVYYPDVGMTEYSTHLSNVQLAPIQITSYGHSVSTHGSLIDYYLVGEDVEKAELAKENYSERVVLLPGIGLINKIPQISSDAKKDESGLTLIAVPCAAHKCNFEFLSVLSRIADEASRDVLFVFFGAAGSLRSAGFIPFFNQVRSVIGEQRAQVLPNLPYQVYLDKIKLCHFSLDAFHYGGCNSVIDSLHLGVPIVCLEGDKWYNRIGPAKLRSLGLDELIVTDVEGYVQKALEMIDEQEAFTSLVSKVENISLHDSELFDKSHAKSFKQTIDYLFENHEKLQQEGSREPIQMSKLLS